MDISRIKSYEELTSYLREFRNWRGDEGPYDFGGVVHLLTALLDNVQAHGVEAEFEEIGEYFTPDQIQTLKRIVSSLRHEKI